VLVEAVTLDEQSRLISRLFRREELASLQIEVEADQPTLEGFLAGQDVLLETPSQERLF
jgi:hypothetical protein